MKRRLHATPLVAQLPIGAENDFEGIVDLVEMKAKVWSGETKLGEKYDVQDIHAAPSRRRQHFILGKKPCQICE